MSKFLKILIVVLVLCSCRMSTSDLAAEVQTSMEESWENQGVEGVIVTSFILTHKGGNEYSGVLKTLEDGESFTYTVEVVYDGESMQWEIIE